MKIATKLVRLGKGRLSSASARGGEIVFVLGVSGALNVVKMKKDGFKPYGKRTVSYFDECLAVGDKLFECREGRIYEIETNT